MSIEKSVDEQLQDGEDRKTAEEAYEALKQDEVVDNACAILQEDITPSIGPFIR